MRRNVIRLCVPLCSNFSQATVWRSVLYRWFLSSHALPVRYGKLVHSVLAIIVYGYCGSLVLRWSRVMISFLDISLCIFCVFSFEIEQKLRVSSSNIVFFRFIIKSTVPWPVFCFEIYYPLYFSILSFNFKLMNFSKTGSVGLMVAEHLHVYAMGRRRHCYSLKDDTVSPYHISWLLVVVPIPCVIRWQIRVQYLYI